MNAFARQQLERDGQDALREANVCEGAPCDATLSDAEPAAGVMAPWLCDWCGNVVTASAPAACMTPHGWYCSRSHERLGFKELHSQASANRRFRKLGKGAARC